MSIGKVVAKQYRDRVNEAILRFEGFSTLPPEGWLRTVRVALGMSGTQLAKRLGVTKARISKIEKDEPIGSVTLRTMQVTAEALGCRFVYAIVPKKDVGSVLKDQAIIKAKERVRIASIHMALEAQSLDKRTVDSDVERIAAEIMSKMPVDFWSEDG